MFCKAGYFLSLIGSKITIETQLMIGDLVGAGGGLQYPWLGRQGHPGGGALLDGHPARCWHSHHQDYRRWHNFQALKLNPCLASLYLLSRRHLLLFLRGGGDQAKVKSVSHVAAPGRVMEGTKQLNLPI
jgi:hypothetical protein